MGAARFGIGCVVLAAILLGGCAHGGLGGMASESDSGNSSDSEGSSDDSSAGSDGSSQGSDNSTDSSRDSGESSRDSGDSSRQSGDSSQESANSTDDESTEQSSNQTTQDSSDDTTDSALSRGDEQVTTGPVLTTAGVLVTGAAVGLIFWLDRGAVEPDRAAVTGEVTRRWLVANSRQLAVDLALGAGPAIEDLAGAAGLEGQKRAIFGRALRSHRFELLELADPAGLDPDRALAFLERTGEIARGQPALADTYRAFVDRVPSAPAP